MCINISRGKISLPKEVQSSDTRIVDLHCMHSIMAMTIQRPALNHALLQVADLGVSYMLMHMRGNPQTMAAKPHTEYGPEGVAAAVGKELQAAAEAAVAAGIEPWRIIIDPGETITSALLA